MRIMLKVISVLVITMMVAKGHGNLLTCHNKVPATFDINYERPVASQLEKTVLFKQLRYTLFIPSRDILCFLFACCLQMLEEQQHVACIQEVIFYFSVFVYFFIYMVHLIGFFSSSLVASVELYICSRCVKNKCMVAESFTNQM